MAKTIVNGLWLGATHLTALELLTLKSFVHHGSEFHLWVYNKIKDKLPPGVVLRDGNELIPADKIFRYPKDMILGFGGGSYVGFSEIFRYKVLYEIGHWWSDMDVVCLKPLEEIEDPYWFRFHGVLSVVGNIMKVPPKSELMRNCLERAEIEVNETTRDWHLAIRILCYHIENLGLSKFIHYNDCNLDRLDFVNKYVIAPGELSSLPSQWRFIHWMNSVISKDYHQDSVFAKLLDQYDAHPKVIKV